MSLGNIVFLWILVIIFGWMALAVSDRRIKDNVVYVLESLIRLGDQNSCSFYFFVSSLQSSLLGIAKTLKE